MSNHRTRLRAALTAGIGVAVLGLFPPGTQATAATINVTFTGSIMSGTDALDQFGGGDLSNDTYVASYAYDSTRGLLKNGQGGQNLIGDFARGDTDPLISAKITIYHAGTKVGSLGTTPQKEFENQLATFNSPSGQVNAQAYYLGDPTPIMIDNNMNTSAAPTTLATTAAFSGTPGGYGDSVLEEFAGSKVSEVLYLDPTHAAFSVPMTKSRAFTAAFAVPDGVSVSSAPEPGAWMLMLMAVGAVGAVLRRDQGSRARPATAV